MLKRHDGTEQEAKPNQIETIVKINLNGEQITQQTEVKYLGVTIDEQLSWKKQVDTVRKKSPAGLAMIRRASAYLPSNRIVPQ